MNFRLRDSLLRNYVHALPTRYDCFPGNMDKNHSSNIFTAVSHVEFRKSIEASEINIFLLG